VAIVIGVVGKGDVECVACRHAVDEGPWRRRGAIRPILPSQSTLMKPNVGSTTSFTTVNAMPHYRAGQ
jgi:hypothetical protein